MNQSIQSCCPICKSFEQEFFIATKALMHAPNQEAYKFNKCLTCDTVFLSNPVDEKVLDNYYTKHYLPYRGADAWGKFKAFVEDSQRALDKKRVRLVTQTIKQKQEPTRILDVGCGKPSFLNLVQKNLNAECIGIDFSDNGWTNLAFENLTLIKTSLADFKPSDNFDIVTMWHYLEHDYHLHATIEKVNSCLKSGGILIVEVPDYQSLTAKLQKQHWQGWHSPRHLTLFSKKGFEVLFPKEKWRITQHKRHGTLDAFTLWWLGKMEQKRIDWSKPMEKEFWPLVFLKMISFPLFLFEKIIPLGIQFIVIEKK
jgi:SAM-dependent methyltransferase